MKITIMAECALAIRRGHASPIVNNFVLPCSLIDYIMRYCITQAGFALGLTPGSQGAQIHCLRYWRGATRQYLRQIYTYLAAAG